MKIQNYINTYIDIICQNKVYIIKSGDKLSTIAKKYNISIEQLAKLNNIKDINKIFVGNKLIIPNKDNNKVSNISNQKYKMYIIKSGDTLSVIAKKYKIPIQQLIKLNNIKNQNYIKVNDTLKIPIIQVKNNFKKKVVNKQNIQQKTSSSNNNKEIEFVARVIYAQTSTKATQEQIKLVCSVIQNRIGQKDFNKNGKTAYDVVKQKNAFSCINDPNNSNWNAFNPQSKQPRMQLAMEYATQLMTNPNTTKFGKTNYVYYHDHSLETAPDNWTNKYYIPKLQKTTQHFKFYSVNKVK